MLTQIWNAHTDIIFCHFRPFFCTFAPLLTPKIKIWKKCKKNTWRYHPFRPLIKMI